MMTAISLNRFFYFIRSKAKPAAVILMYHRISDTSIEPNWLAVSPKNFTAHVQYLKQTFNPMRLTDLVESIKDGSLPDRSVAITFDDGYSDNLTHALPVLESFAVPATIFVTTNYVDSNREPWWDEMKHFLLAPRCVPAQLSIQVADGGYSWPTVTLEDRLVAHQELENLMRPLPVPVNDAILDHLATWAGSRRKLRPAYRTVTMPQLTQLAEHPLIELGAHTLTHPILPTLTPEDQFNEIVGSRYMLEKMIHQPVLSFAYPNGDFTEETRNLVDAAGFNTACTTINGRVEPGDDVFCLRRCAVNDWGIALFKKNLEAFFHDRS